MSSIVCSKHDQVAIRFTSEIKGRLCVPTEKYSLEENLMICREAKIIFERYRENMSIGCKILLDRPQTQGLFDRIRDFTNYHIIKGTVKLYDQKTNTAHKTICLRVARSLFAAEESKEIAEFIEKQIPNTNILTTWSEEEIIGEARYRIKFSNPSDKKAVKIHTLIGKKVLIMNDELSIPRLLDMPYSFDKGFMERGGNNTIYLQHIYHGEKRERIILRVNSNKVDRTLDIDNSLKKIYESLRYRDGFAVPLPITYETLGSSGNHPKRKYIEMLPYCDLGNLKGVQKYFTTFEQIKNAARQMLRVVTRMHSLNIIHRDIKPNNFLVKRTDNLEIEIMLCDFNTAEFCDAYGEVKTFRGCGTLFYQTPEELSKKEDTVMISKRNDLWALGLTLYQLMYRCLPPHLEGIKKQWVEQDLSIPSVLQRLHRAFNSGEHARWWFGKLISLQKKSQKGQFEHMILLLLHPEPRSHISADRALEMMPPYGGDPTEL